MYIQLSNGDLLHLLTGNRYILVRDKKPKAITEEHAFKLIKSVTEELQALQQFKRTTKEIVNDDIYDLILKNTIQTMKQMDTPENMNQFI